MAKSKLPNPLDRRHLLEGDPDPAKALAVAEAYLDVGREVEAVDFLAAAEPGSTPRAREALESLRNVALERGDVFLMRLTCAALDAEPTSEDWKSLSEAANRAGREQDAETAERLATVGD